MSSLDVTNRPILVDLALILVWDLHRKFITISPLDLGLALGVTSIMKLPCKMSTGCL